MMEHRQNRFFMVQAVATDVLAAVLAGVMVAKQSFGWAALAVLIGVVVTVFVAIGICRDWFL